MGENLGNWNFLVMYHDVGGSRPDKEVTLLLPILDIRPPKPPTFAEP